MMEWGADTRGSATDFLAFALRLRKTLDKPQLWSLLNNSRLDGHGLSVCWNPDCRCCRLLPKSWHLPFSGFLPLNVSSLTVGDIVRSGRCRCVRCRGLQRRRRHRQSGFQHTGRPRPSSLELFNKDHNAGCESLSHLIKPQLGNCRGAHSSVTSHGFKWGPFPPNEVGRITLPAALAKPIRVQPEEHAKKLRSRFQTSWDCYRLSCLCASRRSVKICSLWMSHTAICWVMVEPVNSEYQLPQTW